MVKQKIKASFFEYSTLWAEVIFIENGYEIYPDWVSMCFESFEAFEKKYTNGNTSN